MRIVSVLVIALLLLPASFFSVGVPSFEDDKDEVIVSLAAPDYETTVNLVVPADYYVTNATLQVTGMAAEGNASAYPENVNLTLNNKVAWAFNNAGYGPLGLQNIFSNGKTQTALTFNQSGGPREAFIRLPKSAVVQSAKMGLSAMAPLAAQELVNFTEDGNWIGSSVSDAGDVNNDGYGDVIVGAPIYSISGLPQCGRAYVFYGGAAIDNKTDMIFTGEAAGDVLGWSVSSAGDVNNDGYDDVIVGARCNDAGGTDAGRAYIFLGGASMDSTADVILTGAAAGDSFGWSVSGAGDVNNDGYDDVVVGAPYNDAGGADAGRAYIYYGEAAMDNTADVILMGEASGDGFGRSVSGAGDVNADGHNDVIVGALWNDAGGDSAGRAYIYFGGQSMDSKADVIFTGAAAENWLGISVSGAGDVNNDGYDDVIVGADHADTAYIYYGGASIDSTADVILTGEAADNAFGWSVSGTGDVNADGYDDVIVGAPENGAAGLKSGRAYVYFGGAAMDNIVDETFTGESNTNYFGYSVSGAGDVNNDGLDEMIVGAKNYNLGGSGRLGKAYVYTLNNQTGGDILDPKISINSKTVWNVTGIFNGTTITNDFTQVLNDYLSSAKSSGNDSFGNQYVDIPLVVSAGSNGTLNLLNLSIQYQYEASIPNFASFLNGYLTAHKGEKDSNGNLNVPFKIRARSSGKVKLSGLNLTRDLSPAQVEDIKTAVLDEDSIYATLIDLYRYFKDDVDPDISLNFSVVSSTNSAMVNLSINKRRYLSADAETGDANNDWTGTVEAVVACYDHWGSKTESNKFNIIVRNVNDPPEIISTAPTEAEPGVPFYYNVTVLDVDKDPIIYKLTNAPANMTIDPARGNIEWLPRARGTFEVNVIVDDGNATDAQEFYVKVPNRPPTFTSSPPLSATTSVPYVYNLTVEDSNLDDVQISLLEAPTGMVVDSQLQTIAWTPEVPGSFDVSIRAWDGKERTCQNFTIQVIQGNRAPEFKSKPMTTATVDIPYQYNATASDLDKDALSYSIESGPDGMTVDAAKGKVAWTPKTAGNFTVVLKVSDGRGGDEKQEFLLKVSEAVRPVVVLYSPPTGKILKGTVIFTGGVTKGTRDVLMAQLRMDGGEWKDVVGIESWTYTLNTKSFKNGKHSFEFRAYDGKEYSDVVKAEFKVDNPAGGGKGFIPMLDGASALALVAAIGLLIRRRGIPFSKKGG